LHEASIRYLQKAGRSKRSLPCLRMAACPGDAGNKGNDREKGPRDGHSFGDSIHEKWVRKNSGISKQPSLCQVFSGCGSTVQHACLRREGSLSLCSDHFLHIFRFHVRRHCPRTYPFRSSPRYGEEGDPQQVLWVRPWTGGLVLGDLWLSLRKYFR